MKNFIKNNLKKLIVSSLAILCPILFGVIFWNKLPKLIAIHYNFSGEADGFAGKLFAVFGLPLILLAVHWLCMIITAFDKTQADQHPKAMRLIFWIIPLLSLYVSAIMYSGIFGAKFNLGLLTFAFIGITFIIIGNYMPKCKQNKTLGIKIKWTLANEENWNATHRVGGKVWFWGGFVITFLSFLPMEIGFITLLPVILVMVAIPVIYSYAYYKKQLKDGSFTDENLKGNSKKSRAYIIISTIISVIVIVLCAILCFTGDIDIIYSDTAFTVEADYFNDITVNYEDITSVEYRESESRGNRVYGFGSPRLLMGTFKNTEFGHYTRYSYAMCNSCVVLTINEKVLVISGIDDASTSDIYNILIEKCN